jgi:DNA-binding transcriptional ArsR family regulator/uncharacterized protein YndB with AHSA1/START domain
VLKPPRRASKLWRALSSPVRRRILDRLRDGPRTTGELAASFPKLSRFAVMQHLGVLSDARLVLVRREGRFRFNYLNAVPLVQAYERWVSTYAAPMAHGALALKNFLDGGTSMSTTKPRKAPTDFRAVQVELEVKVNAPPQQVWDAMVNSTTHWWRKDFYTNAATKGFHIEPRPGGRMYEDWGGDNGAIWATVLTVDAPRRIQFMGHLTKQYGGPAHSIFEFAIEPSGKGSVLKIADTIFGNLSEDQAAKMDEGWRMLFEEGLKPYVERG